MNTVDGYAITSWERGYGDFEMPPDLGTLRRMPWQEGTAFCLADLRGTTTARRRLAAADPAPPARAPGRARAGGARRRPSSSSCSSTTPTRRRGAAATATSTRRTSTTSTTRCSAPRASSRSCAASATRWPARASRRELQGRVQPRPARDQLPLRPGAADRRRARRLQERRQGDRRPGGHVDLLHGEVRRARGQLVPRPSLGARRTARRLRRRPADLRPFLAGQLATLRADAVLRAERQLLQALRRRLVRPDGDRLGRRQPHVRAPRVGNGPARRIECRLPGADVNPYLALAALIAGGLHGVEQELELEPAFEGNAYASDHPRVPSTLRDAATCSRPAMSRARPSARSRRPLPQLRARRARGVRRGCHRLGARAGVRAAVSGHAADRVFAPVRSQTAFEETVDRLGTAIKLGLLAPGHPAPARARALLAARHRALDAAPGADRADQSGHLHAVRGRGGGTSSPTRCRRRPSPPPSCSRAGARPATRPRRRVRRRRARRRAREARQVDALAELVERWTTARRLRGLPPGRRAAAHQLAEATGSARLVPR